MTIRNRHVICNSCYVITGGRVGWGKLIIRNQSDLKYCGDSMTDV